MPNGRWKIMKGVIRKCENLHCGKDFEPGHPKAKYCSRGCAASAGNQRLRAKVSGIAFKTGYRDGLRTAHQEVRRIMVQQIVTRSNIRLEALLSELGLGFDDLGDAYGQGGVAGGVVVDYPVVPLDTIGGIREY